MPAGMPIMPSCASFSAAEILAPSSPCDSSRSLRISRHCFVRRRIQAIRSAALPQGRLVQLQVLVRARSLRAIQQWRVLAGKLLVSIVLACVRSAEDHGAQAAVPCGQSTIPDRSGRPVPEHSRASFVGSSAPVDRRVGAGMRYLPVTLSFVIRFMCRLALTG